LKEVECLDLPFASQAAKTDSIASIAATLVNEEREKDKGSPRIFGDWFPNSSTYISSKDITFWLRIKASEACLPRKNFQIRCFNLETFLH